VISLLQVSRGCSLVLVLAAGKMEEPGVVNELALLPQLVERRVTRLYRVEEGLPTIVVAFRLRELDLFV